MRLGLHKHEEHLQARIGAVGDAVAVRDGGGVARVAVAAEADAGSQMGDSVMSAASRVQSQ